MNYYKELSNIISDKEKDIITEFIKIIVAENSAGNAILEKIKDESLLILKEKNIIPIKEKGEIYIKIEGKEKDIIISSSEGYISTIYQFKKDNFTLNLCENLVTLDSKEKNIIEVDINRNYFYINMIKEPIETFNYILKNINSNTKDILDFLDLKEDKKYPNELILFIDFLKKIKIIIDKNKLTFQNNNTKIKV